MLLCPCSISNHIELKLCFVTEAVRLLVRTFVLLASSMYCRSTEGKTKCTNCVSLQRGLKLHACIYNDMQLTSCNKGCYVVLTFETVGNWILSSCCGCEGCAWHCTSTVSSEYFLIVLTTVLQVCALHSNSYTTF